MNKLIVPVLLIGLAAVLLSGGLIFAGRYSLDIAGPYRIFSLVLLTAMLLAGIYLLVRVARS